MVKRIGLIATGDELVNGDILNTNGQYFCQQLMEHGMVPGQQVVVGDDEQEIQEAIQFLQIKHDAIITIGGLGPTMDDKTRYAVANALSLPLEFYAFAWQWIIDKITSLGYQTIPENNRQQAFFPKGSEVIQNHQGTAAGCIIHHEKRDYFMLPGPPNECRPMFNDVIIKKLIAQHYPENFVRKSWLLIGVSEGEIASKLEPLMQGHEDCQLGYCVNYPYLEIKLVSKKSASVQALSEKFLPIFSQNIVSENREMASQQLQHWILTTQTAVQIEDEATHGALLHALINPETYPYLSKQKNSTHIHIAGLNAYWQQEAKLTHCPLTLTLKNQNQSKQIILNIPVRGPRTLLVAVERICWEILKFAK